MSISILNRGASGGLKPELTVTAPFGSTIDLLQNGIIVDTYTLSADETEHTFMVKVGTYTVRGTLGAAVKETEVVIDTVGQYEVTIEYTRWLYKDGEEYTDLTGGYSAYTIVSDTGYSQGTVQKKATSLYCATSGMTQSAIASNGAVDFTGYTTINFELSAYKKSYSTVAFVCKGRSAYPNSIADGFRQGITAAGVTSYDISAYDCPMYFGFGCWYDSNELEVSKIWLE
jgi:hypothetical protein